LQAQQLQTTAKKYQDQATQAVAQNREDLARDALSRRAQVATQLEQLKTQHDQLVTQEDHLKTTSMQLQARVEAFRSQKETLKASYTAAQAQASIGEAVSGISESMSDTGLAMQRAQDKIAQMQARASAVDELMASGALDDMSGSSDPIQAELDKGSQNTDIELQLAQIKGQLGVVQPAPSPELTKVSSDTGIGSEEVAASPVAEASPPATNDPFTLDN
jgi:phage shock protein A